MVTNIYSDRELETKRSNTDKEICEMKYGSKTQFRVKFRGNVYDQNVYKKASCKVKDKVKNVSKVANYVNCELDHVPGFIDISFGCKVRLKY